MRPSKREKIEQFIKRKGMVRVSDIMMKFSLSKSATFSYLKDVGALTSFNSKGQYYILAQYHRFDENGLLFIGDTGFCKRGNLLATICHLVEISPRGMGVRELDHMLKTNTHSQLTGLYRTGRLQRESATNRPGQAYMYFSCDPERRRVQKDAYFSPMEEPKEEPKVALLPDELPDAIEVLLTLLDHPDFSAKSVALSLQRRGRKITSPFTARVFQAYDLSKKRP